MQSVQDDDVIEQFEPYEDKLVRFMQTIIPSIIAFIDKFGFSYFFTLIYRYLESIKKNDDEFSRRKKARLSMRLAMLDINEHKLLNVKHSEYDLKEKFKIFLSSDNTSMVGYDF